MRSGYLNNDGWRGVFVSDVGMLKHPEKCLVVDYIELTDPEQRGSCVVDCTQSLGDLYDSWRASCMDVVGLRDIPPRPELVGVSNYPVQGTKEVKS